MSANKGSQGGSWSKETHMKYNGLHTFNNGICNWIMNNLKPKTILEFGCGMGFYANYFSKNGAELVHAIEPDFMGNDFFHNTCLQFNFDATKDNIPEEIASRTYDMVFSLEVMEHIPIESHDKLFDLLCGKADKYIVFSGARIGQFGHGHIACRDEEDWRLQITKRGWSFDTDLTAKIRANSNKINVNHKKNLQIFIK